MPGGKQNSRVYFTVINMILVLLQFLYIETK